MKGQVEGTVFGQLAKRGGKKKEHANVLTASSQHTNEMPKKAPRKVLALAMAKFLWSSKFLGFDEIAAK